MVKHRNCSKIGLAAAATFVVMMSASAVCASTGIANEPTWWGLPTRLLWDLLWRAINFAALAIILIKFLVKPLANALNGRQQTIKHQFEELEAQKAAAEKSYRIYEDKLSQIETEVGSIVDIAIAQGEAEKEKIIAAARQAAADIKRQAEMAVQHELAEAKKVLLTEMADKAILMAAEIIGKNIQPEDHVRLIENSLEKVETVQ